MNPKSHKECMKNILNSNSIIASLAIDQRGAMKKLFKSYQKEATMEDIIEFKSLVSRELTPYTSSILLDPEYGLPAAKQRDPECGLLLAYEKTGYDATIPGRLPDTLDGWTVKRLREEGADACKFLLYYDIDGDSSVNNTKKSFIERIGSECVAENLPFFLELVSYDEKGLDSNSIDYAKIKPHKVNDMIKIFSNEKYHVDVLKVEVPVNMEYVEGYADSTTAYTQEQALKYFKEQSDSTNLPFIFLSAGVSAELFRETLLFAKEAGSTFNGVLCGRATWSDAIQIFVEEGKDATVDWLKTIGKENIEKLNSVLTETATPIELEKRKNYRFS